jgi:L-seryl-tRNA(Ser) seleniumtransferase
MADFRVIPSIDELRRRPAVRALEAEFGADATVDALRAAASDVRAAIAGGDARVTGESATARIEAAAGSRLRVAFRSSLQPVINATGVILHTNLGRAPLAAPVIDRIARIASGYSSLEYDLGRGTRGRRDVHAEALLCRLTGAEAAVVVNNNAAATMIVLAALAAGREVIVSRGELVEIGGGFRVPDVMAQSGALLREVGTTNKTRAADYAAAITEKTALILRVHPSNFRIAGFTERPQLPDLVTLGKKFNIPVAEDLGSGLLHQGIARELPGNAETMPRQFPGNTETMPRQRLGNDEAMPRGRRGDSHGVATRGPGNAEGGTTERAGDAEALSTEPAVRETVAAGVDICCFSGDKLLGGPQAGVIVGRTALVDRIRKHPLMRALRVDKMTYAALEATLVEYAAGRAAVTVPVQRMLAATADQIRARADAVAAQIAARNGWRSRVVEGRSAVGGGSAPGVELPTWLVVVEQDGVSPDALEERLRRLTPPVIARIDRDRVVLDLRTVAPDQDAQLASLVAQLT